jgi:cyclic pyranopterin phosphate synthase
MSDLTHLDDEGRAHMVDVGGKPETERRAVARAFVEMEPETLALLAGGAPKGDVMAAARIAGIQAAKRTGDLIPLCHPVPLTHASVEVAAQDDPPGVEVVATCHTVGRTGVEMEALTAASVAALAVYDMLKAADRGMVVRDVMLLSKEGGASGTWERDEA